MPFMSNLISASHLVHCSSSCSKLVQDLLLGLLVRGHCLSILIGSSSFFFFFSIMATSQALKPVLSKLEVPGDETFATLTGDLCWPGPHLKVNIDQCENTPFRLIDRLMANGGLSCGAVKIRLYSASGKPVPTPFDAFLRGDWCDPFGEAADDPDLIDRYHEYGIVPLERDQVFRRWSRPVSKPGSLRSVIRSWSNRGLMRIDPSATPDNLLTSAFLGFRRASERMVPGPGIPYLADWSCSLFRIHHVNFGERQEWQQDHHFGVSDRDYLFPWMCVFFSSAPVTGRGCLLRSSQVVWTS